MIAKAAGPKIPFPFGVMPFNEKYNIAQNKGILADFSSWWINRIFQVHPDPRSMQRSCGRSASNMIN
jgi:hypothetical protein